MFVYELYDPGASETVGLFKSPNSAKKHVSVELDVPLTWNFHSYTDYPDIPDMWWGLGEDGRTYRIIYKVEVKGT